jgi:hypothetical protein
MKHLFFALIVIGLNGCTLLNLPTTTTSGSGIDLLTNQEVIRGLKEALTVGTNNSTAMAARTDGFLKNPQLFIPWPAEAIAMKEKLIQLGFQSKVNEFETSLNRAAEEAAKEAAPIFIDAITTMNVTDGFTILRGNDTAATHYLREKTYAPLKSKFSPKVKAAIDKVNVTAYWTPLANVYNAIPTVKKVNPDLNEYVTNKAINGLMLLIGKEETKIRTNVNARVTDLLKKVFANRS